MHRATRLHFDFRLEIDGVYKSWAVPKGPSLNPLDQRLAVFVEDHPLEYGDFEGIIPPRNYGAGTVMIWDRGVYLERSSETPKSSNLAMREGLAKGHLAFVLDGEKLKGEFALIKLKKDKSQRAWLLVKKRDGHANYARKPAFENASVKTGRAMDDIAAESEKRGDVWLPKRATKGDGKIADSQRSAGREKTRAALLGGKKKKAAPPRRTSGAEPMPRRLKPMLAAASREAISGDEWIVDAWHGGLRALAEIEGRRCGLYSKSGLSFNKRFPQTAAALQKLGQDALLDGEIVERGSNATFIVSDLLWLNGRDLRKEGLAQRRALLTDAIRNSPLANGKSKPPAGAAVQIVAGPEAGGRSPRAPVEYVAKRADSIYRAGVSRDWLAFPASVLSSAAAAPKRARTRSPKGAPLPAARAKPAAPGLDEPRLTNLNKVYWPGEGITKGDLIEYYRAVAPKILPHLKDRPESLNRQPNGVAAPGFFQKDMTGHLPRWLKTTRLFSESSDRSIDYALCQDLRSLLFLANLGCIELNPWFSRLGSLDRPDYSIIDLDPDDNPFSHVVEVAQECRRVLDAIGAKSACKTSGATGVHIGVPLGARYGFDESRAFAEAVCRVVHRRFPSTTSLDRNPNRRRGKIYLDFMQNRRGQTLAAAFCVRPKPRAPVSMPLAWKELKPDLRPDDFRIDNAVERILRKPDPWSLVLGRPIAMAQCASVLRTKFRLD